MNRLLLPPSLLSLTLLVACPWDLEVEDGGDDDFTTDDDSGDDDSGDDDSTPTPCAAEARPLFALCTGDFAPDPLRGHFLSWEEGDVRFLDEEDTEWEFWVWGDPADHPLIPDPTGLGEVEVRQEGGCDGKGGAYSVVAVYTLASMEDPVFAVGSTAPWEAGDWSVQSPPDVTTCEGQGADCFEWIHNKPVHFGVEGESVTLFQGESQGLEQAEVYVLSAWSASGETLCSDVGTEMVNWVVIGRGVRNLHIYISE